eukprot:jgi/Bigna1/79662/fgenesh1_pg.64_\
MWVSLVKEGGLKSASYIGDYLDLCCVRDGKCPMCSNADRLLFEEQLRARSCWVCTDFCPPAGENKCLLGRNDHSNADGTKSVTSQAGSTRANSGLFRRRTGPAIFLCPPKKRGQISYSDLATVGMTLPPARAICKIDQPNECSSRLERLQSYYRRFSWKRKKRRRRRRTDKQGGAEVGKSAIATTQHVSANEHILERTFNSRACRTELARNSEWVRGRAAYDYYRLQRPFPMRKESPNLPIYIYNFGSPGKRTHKARVLAAKMAMGNALRNELSVDTRYWRARSQNQRCSANASHKPPLAIGHTLFLSYEVKGIRNQLPR